MFKDFKKKLVHFEFRDNRHKSMKVIDAKGEIC